MNYKGGVQAEICTLEFNEPVFYFFNEGNNALV